MLSLMHILLLKATGALWIRFVGIYRNAMINIATISDHSICSNQECSVLYFSSVFLGAAVNGCWHEMHVVQISQLPRYMYSHLSVGKTDRCLPKRWDNDNIVYILYCSRVNTTLPVGCEEQCYK